MRLKVSTQHHIKRLPASDVVFNYKRSFYSKNIIIAEYIFLSLAL